MQPRVKARCTAALGAEVGGERSAEVMSSSRGLQQGRMPVGGLNGRSLV